MSPAGPRLPQPSSARMPLTPLLLSLGLLHPSLHYPGSPFPCKPRFQTYAMITTHTHAPPHSQDAVDVGWTSVWVKIVTQWVAAALYCWALAPPSFQTGSLADAERVACLGKRRPRHVPVCLWLVERPPHYSPNSWLYLPCIYLYDADHAAFEMRFCKQRRSASEGRCVSVSPKDPEGMTKGQPALTRPAMEARKDTAAATQLHCQSARSGPGPRRNSPRS